MMPKANNWYCTDMYWGWQTREYHLYDTVIYTGWQTQEDEKIIDRRLKDDDWNNRESWKSGIGKLRTL